MFYENVSLLFKIKWAQTDDVLHGYPHWKHLFSSSSFFGMIISKSMVCRMTLTNWTHTWTKTLTIHDRKMTDEIFVLYGTV